MIKIYGSKNSSAMRCLWLLEEVGAPYENQALDFQKKEHKAPEYLKLNPNGKIPTMVDGEVVLWESLAINSYIAEKYKPELLGTSAQERGLVNQWSLWALMHLYAAFYPLVIKTWRKSEETEETKKALMELPQWLGILNSQLMGKDYMVGERFTLADLNLLSVVQSAAFISYSLSDFPEIERWQARLMERAALKKIMAA